MNTIKKIYNIISWPVRTFEKLNSYSQAKYQKWLWKKIAHTYDLAKEKAFEQLKDLELSNEISIENKILIKDHAKFHYFDKFFQIESSELDSQSKRRQSIHFLMQDLMKTPEKERELIIAKSMQGNLTQFIFDIKIHSLLEKREIEESEFHEKALSNPISKGGGRPPQNGVAPANLLIIKYAVIHKEYPRTKPGENDWEKFYQKLANEGGLTIGSIRNKFSQLYNQYEVYLKDNPKYRSTLIERQMLKEYPKAENFIKQYI